MIVNVKNSLEHNGTSIHWHGLRQLNTNQHDGVNGITECPIAPGQTKQYIIRCTQHGTSWYHSHHSAQYGDGIVGGIVINGPATSNYDTDLGTFSMTDWFHEDVFAMNWRALHSSVGPPTPESALLNGTMKTANGGKYHVTKVTKGKRFRLRLINTAVDNNFHVSIDNHNFTVIASDFVPIKPYVATSVIVNIGQRHDIIITANQDIGNYWLRADVAACAGNGLAGNVLSIIRYENATETEPTTVNTWQKPTGCYDETVRPYVNNTVPRDQFLEALGTISMDFNVTTTSSGGALVQWLINGSDIRVDWERPTLGQVLDGNFTFAPKSNVFEITRPANSWTFWIIQSVQDDPFFLVHPIHLHGHDFYVLGHAENSVWDGNVDALMFDNPPRRDTATLPAGGYLILGFPADNPGTPPTFSGPFPFIMIRDTNALSGMWLMHCHIAFHVGQGLSLQFLERKDEIASAIGDLGDYEETCASWRTWWNGPDRVYEMDDSGL